MAQVEAAPFMEAAPFLLVRRSEPPPAVLRYKGRLRRCQAVFALAMLGLCSLLAYEVKEAKEAGMQIAALPLP